MRSLVEEGDKLHVITRRLFEDDVRRHFAGEVVNSVGDLVELRGYSFVYNPSHNSYRKLPEVRNRFFAVGDSGLVVNRIPKEVDVAAVEYRVMENRLVLTDGSGFTLAINEFGPKN